MRDNVTPFRPRRPPPKAPRAPNFGIATHRGRAVLVQLLTLIVFVLSFFLRFPPWSYLVTAIAVAGVAVAASSRAGAMPWAATHHEHALRTLLFGYTIITLVSLISLLFPPSMAAPTVLFVVMQIQLWTTILVAIWAAIRAGVGLVLAIMRKPIWHPKGLLL